ncbi:GNAT family N-acetyltransferase [Flavobacterium qiangtangense]|uniref:GNAT family N-acetyltransferase n=1 Tax=Flavobacterium qiangtangense TaxID=1442595 RepID=A0ABW1PQE9_9FLAO
MNIEKIETERLLLIPFTKQLCHLVNDKNFVALQNNGLNAGEGYPDQETLDTIPKIVANIELSNGPTGFESWVIITKQEMKIIGDVGFKGIPNQAGEIDLGYGIIASERQKGYAFEAAKALCDWAISQENVNTITAKCLVENEGSYKTLEKLNFKRITEDESMFHYIFK